MLSRTLATIGLLLLAVASRLLAAGTYAQMVVPFRDERPMSYEYRADEHALVLAFQKTTPADLTPLERYDERMVRRVVITDLGPQGTEVKLILRDRNVRALVSRFSDPYRVAIDLFDASYAESRDAATNLPGADLAPVAGAAPYSPSSPAATSGDLKWVREPDANTQPSPPSDQLSSVPAGRRRLLQPLPSLFTSVSELDQAMKGAIDGPGKAWRSYPPYIYRLQTAAYERSSGREADKLAAPAKALTSAEAMAEYGGKLFNFGHDAKALIAYQQVLQKDARLFDKDALHLWKFAEVHFGQGNLALAHGYFDAIAEKYPESPLAAFAKLRALDVESVRHLQLGKANEWPTLLPKLAAIPVRQTGELAALIAIRQAYWAAPAVGKAATYSKDVLPPLPEGGALRLQSAYPQTESSRTAFLAASLILWDRLRPSVPYERADATFADAYFKRFVGSATEPFRDQIESALTTKVHQTLRNKAVAGKLLEVIGDFEALPPSLKAVRAAPETAWALGESYRKLSQTANAIDFYAAAAKTDDEGPSRFKAQFWLAVTAGEEAENLKARGDSNERSQRLAAQSRSADRAAQVSWDRLKDSEKNGLSIAYFDAFAKTVTAPSRLATGPRILLTNWSKALSSKTTTQAAGDGTDWLKAYSPSGSTVILLSDLGKRFGELGLAKERRQAVGLMKFLKPKDLGDDQGAKEIWARELINLAEDYRRANQYLDAGRLFSLVGQGAENFEGRAEALYKGGLLLYRAGRREEALEAFKKAGEDGNNLFYANLAKERLSQLTP